MPNLIDVYNGVKYYNTKNGNTVDGLGIINESEGESIVDSTLQGILLEPQATNLFLNSKVPVTQTITVTSGIEYTISVRGSGNIVLSNAGVGTVTENNNITITTISTSLVCTVNGDLEWVNVEQGLFATSFIETIGTSITRLNDELIYKLGAGNFPQSFTFISTIYPFTDGDKIDDSNFNIFNTDDTAGIADEITTEGSTSYGYVHATGGGKFTLKKDDFLQNHFYRIGFSLSQLSASNIKAIIVVTDIGSSETTTKLNILVDGVLNHSDTGKLIFGEIANFKNFKFLDVAYTETELILDCVS